MNIIISKEFDAAYIQAGGKHEDLSAIKKDAELMKQIVLITNDYLSKKMVTKDTKPEKVIVKEEKPKKTRTIFGILPEDDGYFGHNPSVD